MPCALNTGRARSGGFGAGERLRGAKPRATTIFTTTGGDNPRIAGKDGLFVSCAGGPQVQLRGDRDTPALAVVFGGKQTRLKQGDTADVGPYRFALLEQSGNGGRQLRFRLTLN